MILYRDAKESDLANIASLHIDCFNGTFIASLGEQLVANYYFEFLKEGDPFVLAFEKDKLIGLCMGYFKGSQGRKMFISNNRTRLGLRVLCLCLSFNKLAISKCWNYLFPLKKRSDCSTPRIEAESDLLSICVRKEYRGQGVSKGLTDEFEKRLSRAGKSDVSLSVYKTNTRAIAFYQKLGYSIICESTDEYKMYKKLN